MNGIDGAVRHFRNLWSWWDFRYFYLHIGYFRLHGVCIALFIALFGCFFRRRLLGGRYRALLQVLLCWAFVKMRLILLALFGLLCGLAQVYGSRSITVKILNIVVCNIRWALLTLGHIYFRGPPVVMRLFFVRCVYYKLIRCVWLV